MDKPLVVERFADNGEHSHWELIAPETGETLWDEGDEEKDLFALSFLAWHNHHPQAQMYHNAGASTYELLQKYKSRPYIDNNPENQ